MAKARKLTRQEMRILAKYPETDTFCWENANPKGHITGDCWVRAIAGATGKTWDEVVEGVMRMMIRHKRDLNTSIEKYLEAEGWIKHKQPKNDDGTKVTAGVFAQRLSANDPDGKTGNVICTVTNHHLNFIRPTRCGDGPDFRYKVIDSWDSSDKYIRNYWTKPGYMPDVSGIREKG